MTCEKCGGLHFNSTKDGELICASVSEFTDFKVKIGGCGWRTDKFTKNKETEKLRARVEELEKFLKEAIDVCDEYQMHHTKNKIKNILEKDWK